MLIAKLAKWLPIHIVNVNYVLSESYITKFNQVTVELFNLHFIYCSDKRVQYQILKYYNTKQSTREHNEQTYISKQFETILFIVQV